MNDPSAWADAASQVIWSWYLADMLRDAMGFVVGLIVLSPIAVIAWRMVAKR